MKETTNIPGYTYGTAAVSRSPVTLADFELMKKSVLFGDAPCANMNETLPPS